MYVSRNCYEAEKKRSSRAAREITTMSLTMCSSFRWLCIKFIRTSTTSLRASTNAGRMKNRNRDKDTSVKQDKAQREREKEIQGGRKIAQRETAKEFYNVLQTVRDASKRSSVNVILPVINLPRYISSGDYRETYIYNREYIYFVPLRAPRARDPRNSRI